MTLPALTRQHGELEPSVVEAQRDAAVELLVALLRQVTRIGGYKTTEELQTLWQIHALLTELGVEYR